MNVVGCQLQHFKPQPIEVRDLDDLPVECSVEAPGLHRLYQPPPLLLIALGGRDGELLIGNLLYRQSLVVLRSDELFRVVRHDCGAKPLAVIVFQPHHPVPRNGLHECPAGRENDPLPIKRQLYQ